MILPIKTDSPLRGTPYMNWALIAANTVMFIVQRSLWPEGSPWALDPRELQLSGYFTYQFLHGDVLHLFGNMLFLYIFGNNVNDKIGNWGYLAFYLAGGVAAGIGHVLTSDGPVIGASGSVSAITGAYLALLPRSHITVFVFFYIIGRFEIPSMYFIIASFLKDFLFSFGADTMVAHSAHLAGSVFGFAISMILLAVRMLPRDPMDFYAIFRQWNRRRQYRDVVNAGYDPFGLTPRQRKPVIDPNQDRIHDIRAQISEAMAHDKMDDAVRLYLELRAIDPRQVLSRQAQLDIANQLFSTGVHGAAADAYENFIQAYPRYEQIEQVHLMLGLLYARYLNRPDRARTNLTTALERLHDSRQIEMAKGELERIGAPVQG